MCCSESNIFKLLVTFKVLTDSMTCVDFWNECERTGMQSWFKKYNKGITKNPADKKIDI